MTTIDDMASLMVSMMERNQRIRAQNLAIYHDQAAMAGLKRSQFDHHVLRTTVPGPQFYQPQQTLGSSSIEAQRFRSALAVLSDSSSPPSTPSSSSLSPSSLTDVHVLSMGRQHRHLDRSISEPLSSAAAAAMMEQATDGMGSGTAFCRYKTELCRPFEENGSCKYADKCQFAHGRAELRTVVRHPKYKTDLCRTYHMTGLCPYGQRCHFIHNDEERRLSEFNRMTIDGQQQQRSGMFQQQASVQQQDMAIAAALIAQHRCLAAVQSPTPSQRQQQQHVEQAIASSLQRSLSLGGRTTAGGSHGFRVNTSVPDSSGCGRGSVDSMTSIGSSPSPTYVCNSSSSASSTSSASSSDVESTGDRRHDSRSLQRVDFASSSETAIMLALMARRLRDGESLQQATHDGEVKAVLAKLLQSASPST